jgi:hypothetical protein
MKSFKNQARPKAYLAFNPDLLVLILRLLSFLRAHTQAPTNRTASVSKQCIHRELFCFQRAKKYAPQLSVLVRKMVPAIKLRIMGNRDDYLSKT